MTRDEAVAGLSTSCHLLLGVAMGRAVDAYPDKSPQELWAELTPLRRAVYAYNVALGLPTLAPPYVDDEDLPDWQARHPNRPKDL